MRAETSYRRAVVMMTVTSFLVPAAGLVTAPVLARALDVAGRGQLAAAIAPAGLMLAAATMGLPDAVTYYVAKRPDFIRRAVAGSSTITGALALVCVLIVLAALPFLRGGNGELGHLILLASLLTVPALVIGVLRGAAVGAQMWGAIAAERMILIAGRVIIFVTLYATHDLTVTNAVLVNVVLPIVAGITYVGLLRRPATGTAERATTDVTPLRDLRDLQDLEHGPFELEGTQGITADAESQADLVHGDVTLRLIVSFGSRVWFGSVASMVLDREAPLLMVPLSNAVNLGLYTVANTVSDLPLLVALAISGALFGATSKTTNIDRVTNTSRLSLLTCGIGCALLVGTIHLWIGPIFGYGFSGAVFPTVILTAGSLIVIPGVMAASALTAWGRPGLRSVGLAITLAVSLPLFFLLVPPFGVYGACWTELICSVLMSTLMIRWCTRIIGVRASLFFVIRWTDVTRLWQEGKRAIPLALALTPRNRRRESTPDGVEQEAGRR